VKVLLDEQLSPRIAHILRARGLEVEAVAERVDLPESSDRDVMEAAASEERAVATANVKDFRPIGVERLTDGRGHAGLILMPANRSFRRDAVGDLADAIEAVMRAHPDGIRDQEHWLAPLP
jgi:Domain of unknown function (DUF5615)